VSCGGWRVLRVHVWRRLSGFFTPTGMSLSPDGMRDAFAGAVPAAGHARKGRSRYGDKPALFAGTGRPPVWNRAGRPACG
jgi:hypothetical protein